MNTCLLDSESADSALEVSVNANWKIVEELRGDEHMCQALLEIMEPEINKIKEAVKEEVTEEVTKQERRKGIKTLVTFLRNSGQNDAEIMNAIIKVYDVSVIDAESYL